MSKIIEKLFIKYNLGDIKSIELFDSCQNKVYDVITSKSRYVVKEFSNDSIGNYYQLSKRKNQIAISELLNKKGIKCSLPINLNDNKFLLFDKKYYLIYDYLDYKPLKNSEVTLEHIDVLASTQARIHKVKTNISLTNHYRVIKIDFDKQLKLLKRVDKDVYQVLADNVNTMIDIVKNCNAAIRVLKHNLCIGHNDYKLLNILWKDMDMVLVDFDALGYSNPTVSLCESAFTFARMGKRINYEYYEEYLRSYIKEYGNIKENYKAAIIASFNGKLQWLNYMFSKNGKSKDNYRDSTKHMIEELILYYKNIDKFNRIYEKVISEL